MQTELQTILRIDTEEAGLTWPPFCKWHNSRCAQWGGSLELKPLPRWALLLRKHHTKINESLALNGVQDRVCKELKCEMADITKMCNITKINLCIPPTPNSILNTGIMLTPFQSSSKEDGTFLLDEESHI